MSDAFHLIFVPLLPAWLLTLLAIGAGLIVAWALVRHAKGGLCRGFLFALLLAVLANPSLIRETRTPLKDTALLVVDDSASMHINQRTAQSAQAASAMAEKLAAFADLDVETLHVNGQDETDLFHAIESKLRQMPAGRLAGIIAITDGQIHDAPDEKFDAPFHVLLAGAPHEIDRRIKITASPAYGIVGQKSKIKLRLDDDPEPQSQQALVTISRDTGETSTIQVPVGKEAEIDVDLPHAGSNPVGFEVEALPHEATTINNAALVKINGIRDRLRVLLVSGQPSIGGRQWLNLLKSDAAVDTVPFTILRSPMSEMNVPVQEMALIPFPTQELFQTKLHNFDLVIFDGFSNRLLMADTYLDNIADYVEKGGALLVSNATGAMAAELGQSPLARILPAQSRGEVLSGAFVPTLSDAGLRHPVTTGLDAALPHQKWAPWYRQVDAVVQDEKSQVLMTGIQKKPLLVLSRVGKGRVAQFLSNQFWLWSRQYPEGGPEAEMQRRTAHWLMKEPELDETALSASTEKTDQGWFIHIQQQSLSNSTSKAILTGPNNQPVSVTLSPGNKSGILQADIPVQQAGLYHIKNDDHETLAMAGANGTPEFTTMAATDKIVMPIVDASNGSVNWLADQPQGLEIHRTGLHDRQSGSGWIGMRKNGRSRVTGSEAIALWPVGLAAFVLLAAAMFAWRREGE